MATLSAAVRNRLRSTQFGMPGQRKYPMEDRAHQIAAKGRANQMVKKGKLAPSTRDKIVAKANALLKK